jgi:formylglycine-generating enzyme required for sulfatase activity
MCAKGRQAIPYDIVEVRDAQYAPLEDLAPGSREAQERQRQAVQQLGLPLEVRARKTGIVFRLVAAGSFTMGSPSDEGHRFDDETQHDVTLTKAFYCGKFEVTQGQWKQVIGDNPSYFGDPVCRGDPDHPVQNVSWQECQAFLKRLCQMEGVSEATYRLLTEAEWEYACRAGTQTAFCWGSDLDSNMAKFGVEGSRLSALVRVGSFRPNAWGLYDMHGNVQEWCQDWYRDYPSGVAFGPLSGVSRVIRGGAWGSCGSACRSASRGWLLPRDKGVGTGLRVARTIPSSP